MERLGLLGEVPVGADGQLFLILPGDATELIDPDLDDAEIARRYNLDRIVRMPKLELCTATYLDGPLAGTTNTYVVRRLGARCDVALPPPPGGFGTYELVKLPEDDQPGELRFVELIARPPTTD